MPFVHVIWRLPRPTNDNTPAHRTHIRHCHLGVLLLPALGRSSSTISFSTLLTAVAVAISKRPRTKILMRLRWKPRNIRPDTLMCCLHTFHRLSVHTTIAWSHGSVCDESVSMETNMMRCRRRPNSIINYMAYLLLFYARFPFLFFRMPNISIKF